MTIVRLTVRTRALGLPLREMMKFHRATRAAARIANQYRPLHGKKLRKWVTWRRRRRYWNARVHLELDRRFGPGSTLNGHLTV